MTRLERARRVLPTTFIRMLAATTLLVAAYANASAAGEFCTYRNGYYDPDLSGACTVETMVPEGCPLHVATPSGTSPSLVVYRGMDPVPLPSSATVVDTLSVGMNRVDPFDCDCASTPGAAAFDRHEVMVTGAVAGDVVAFDTGQLDTAAAIDIGPPGPCPAPQWPTMFTIATRCDRCSLPDPEGDQDDSNAGGCSAAGGPGGFAAFAAFAALFAAQRRRSRAHRRS